MNHRRGRQGVAASLPGLQLLGQKLGWDLHRDKPMEHMKAQLNINISIGLCVQQRNQSLHISQGNRQQCSDSSSHWHSRDACPEAERQCPT